MLIFYCISLIIAVVTFNYYIVSGVHTGIHRLLPMTIAEIAVSDILQILMLVDGKSNALMLLDDLLMLQILHLLMNYIQEFNNRKLSIKHKHVLGGSVLMMLVVVLLQFQFPMFYAIAYNAYMLCYTMILLLGASWILKKNYFSNNERKVVRLLYVALLATGISIVLRKVPFLPGYVIMTGVFDFTCIGIFYLMYTRKLMDNVSLMQRELFDTADMGKILFDADFCLLDVNNIARDAFSIDIENVRHKELREQFREGVWQLATAKNQTMEIEYEGKFFRCIMEEFHEQEELRGYILSIIDITDERQQLQKLEQLRREAEEQSILKSKFLANMSHDLRSPLHAIIGASDVLIGKSNLTATNRSYVQMIRNSSKVLLGLVNDILLYSKLEAGKLVLSKKPYSLEGMLKDLSQMMVMNLSMKPVKYCLRFVNSYPSEVVGDQMRVRGIVQNILSNAVKFTEEGQIICEVSCEQETESNRIKITCRISDTGPGMSQEQLRSVFDEYTSFADIRSKDGTGLGLSIARQLAQLMEGSISAESDGQTGSTVTACFYQEMETECWKEPIEYTQNELIKAKSPNIKIDVPPVQYMEANVLVVDDLDVNLQVFKQIVGRWGIHPDVASSGAQAVEMVKKKAYHLIFLDLMMPEMDGIETAAKIKEIAEVPLILLTADASDEVKRRSKEVGFVDYMSKPIENTRLESNFIKYIPKEYRIAANQTNSGEGEVMNQQELLAYRAILETVTVELQQLHKSLPEYLEKDLPMFRIKVHGIKGFTRQIHRLAISKQAEIMEMAAKTENLRFIEENIDDFLLEIKETIDEITEELAVLPQKEVKQSDEGVVDLWIRLKQSFDDFDLMGAEDCVEQLKQRELGEKEMALLEQLEQACVDIEYEMGSELLESYLKQMPKR